VFPIRYDLRFYIPEDGILHSHHRDYLNSYIALTSWALAKKSRVSRDVRTGFFLSQKTAFFIITAVKTTILIKKTLASPYQYYAASDN
jgi:hypothetical protein